MTDETPTGSDDPTPDPAQTSAATPATPPDTGSSDEVAAGPTAEHADIAGMGYEQARDELVSIVSRLEAGRTELEESMRLWERGEALAAHCTRWLDGAQERLEHRVAEDG